jgi:hypothetical protein
MKKESSQISFLERLDLDTIEEDWLPPTEFPDLTKSEYIAIDLETNDPNLMELGPGWARDDGFIVGIAIAAGDFVGYYPIRHEAGGNIPQRKVMTWLKDQLNTPHIPKIILTKRKMRRHYVLRQQIMVLTLKVRCGDYTHVL